MPSGAFPAQPGTEILQRRHTNPQSDFSHGAQTGQWGLSRSPSSAQELADSVHMSHGLLQRGRCPQERSRSCSHPGWYLPEPKEGKKDGASYSTCRLHRPPWRTSPSFTCWRQFQICLCSEHEGKMKIKLLDISKWCLLHFWPRFIWRSRVSQASCKTLQTSGEVKETRFYLLAAEWTAWDSVSHSSVAGFVLFTPRARAQHGHVQEESYRMSSANRISTVGLFSPSQTDISSSMSWNKKSAPEPT